MRVTRSIYKSLQNAVYDGEFLEELVPTYAEFADFCETSISSPVYIKLLEGLTKLEVE